MIKSIVVPVIISYLHQSVESLKKTAEHKIGSGPDTCENHILNIFYTFNNEHVQKGDVHKISQGVLSIDADVQTFCCRTSNFSKIIM